MVKTDDGAIAKLNDDKMSAFREFMEVINGTWSKENRLSELKTELAAVERKIQLSITPETKEESIEQVDKQKESPNISESILRTKGIHLSRGLL